MNINVKLANSVYFNQGIRNLLKRNIPEKYLYDLLLQLNFLNGNCCEVGSGYYSFLGTTVQEELKKKRKQLTIYNQKLMMDELNGAILKKEPFTTKTDIHEIDTIYGLYPCESSIAMIDKAIKENKNLLLAFCSCDLSDRVHKKWVGDYWADDVCMDYKEKYEQEFEVKRWPNDFKKKTPILIRRKQIE